MAEGLKTVSFVWGGRPGGQKVFLVLGARTIDFLSFGRLPLCGPAVWEFGPLLIRLVLLDRVAPDLFLILIDVGRFYWGGRVKRNPRLDFAVFLL